MTETAEGPARVEVKVGTKDDRDATSRLLRMALAERGELGRETRRQWAEELGVSYAALMSWRRVGNTARMLQLHVLGGLLDRLGWDLMLVAVRRDAQQSAERDRIAQVYRDWERARAEGERSPRHSDFVHRSRFRLSMVLGMVDTTSAGAKAALAWGWDDLDVCGWPAPAAACAGDERLFCGRRYGHHWEGTRHGVGDQQW